MESKEVHRQSPVIRLVALDVDGTLINDQHEIMPLTKRRLQELAAEGMQIVLCTGRGPLSTLPLLRELGFEGYLLNHNGGVICHSEPYRIIEQSRIELDDIRELVDYCRRENVHFDLCTANHLYCETLGEYEGAMYASYLVQPILIKDAFQLAEPLIKLTLFGPPEWMDRVQVEVEGLKKRLMMIRSDERFIDFMLPGINKGSALRSLCQRLGIAAEEVLAIGNYYNDLQMIEYAGIGVAMGNAPADLQARATAVTASNNEEGVYWALEKFIN